MTLEQSEEVIQENVKNITGILFVDSTRVDTTLENTNGKEEGMVGNLLTSIRGMFSSKGKTVYQFGQEIADSIPILEVDTNNKELYPLKDKFKVDTVPYLVLLYCNEILFADIPLKNNTNEIYDIVSTFEPNSPTKRYCVGHTITSSEEEEKSRMELKSPEKVPERVVTISEGQHRFKSKIDDPYYYGDNEVDYDTKWYKDPMNGGLISKSSRVPGFNASEIVVEQPTIIIDSNKPYERLSLVDEVSYYEDFDTIERIKKEPPPVKIEIDEIEEGTDIHEISLDIEETVSHNVTLNIEETIVNEVSLEIDKPSSKEISFPFARKIKLDRIVPVKIAQVEPEIVEEEEKPTIVEKVEEVWVWEEEEEPVEEIIEVIKQPVIEIFEQPIIEVIEQPPIYIQRRVPSNSKYYGNSDKTVYHEISSPQKASSEMKNKTEIYRRSSQPSRSSVKTSPVPPLPKSQNYEVKNQWKRVLDDEEQIMEKINRLYEEDKKLSSKIKESESVIRSSENKYKKAQKEIERQIKESEGKMSEYEKKLNSLYNARELALKAREDLYKPCTSCRVNTDSVVESRLNKPYKISSKSLPADQSNFHDLYESAMHKKPGSKSVKKSK